MNKWQVILLLVSGIPWMAMWFYRVDHFRLAWQWALLQLGVLVGQVLLASVPARVTGWRGRLAARIPVLYGWSLMLLIWYLPIQTFLLYTLDAGAWFPVLSLATLGVALGLCLPESYMRLRPWEADGRIYGRLGVRRFRNLVSDGDLVVRLIRWIDPTAYARLRRSTLPEREAGTRFLERVHAAELLASVPVGVWAILAGQSWFAVYLLVSNIACNIYPILLERYTRARYGRIRAHARCRANRETAEPPTSS